MYKDVFGREILKGQVVLISRAGQGAKSFEKGIVTGIKSGKATWLNFSSGHYYRRWSQDSVTGAWVQDKTDTFRRNDTNKLKIYGENSFVHIVSDPHLLDSKELSRLAKEMKSDGTLHSGYILGQPVIEDPEDSDVLSSDAGSDTAESFESDNLDILGSLGAPSIRGSDV